MSTEILVANPPTSVFLSNSPSAWFCFVSFCAMPPLLDGQYFSEEQMRMREPLLYEQYIGQYLTDEEVSSVYLAFYM